MSAAPFQSPTGDFDPALLLLNLRNKDEGDNSDELRRMSSQTSAGQITNTNTENEELGGGNFTREPSVSPADSCTCKKSKCLKKYCQCFAMNAICNQLCRCIECENTSYENLPRKRAIEELLVRNPAAFIPKIKIDTAITEDADVIQQTSHRVGCRCRKSMCLKKYCECYQGGVLCSTICTCLDCRNKGEGTGTEEPIANADAQMDMELGLVKAKIIKKQTSFTRKRPLSFLEEESPNCSNYDAAKFFPDDNSSLQVPSFMASTLAGSNASQLSLLSNHLSSSGSSNVTSLLSANLLKHALSSSSSAILTRNHTFPNNATPAETDMYHCKPTQHPEVKRMKSLTALEISSPVPSHKTPANASTVSSGNTTHANTSSTASSSQQNTLETPRHHHNNHLNAISPQSWSIAQAFYRLGDEFASAAKMKSSNFAQYGNNNHSSNGNNSLLLTDEQRKAIRLSMSSSISTEGREAIAESVLRTLRFSAENFFQQFSESVPPPPSDFAQPTEMDVDADQSQQSRTRALSEIDNKKENDDPCDRMSRKREIESVFKSPDFVKKSLFQHHQQSNPNSAQKLPQKPHASSSVQQDKANSFLAAEGDSETESEDSDHEDMKSNVHNHTKHLNKEKEVEDDDDDEKDNEYDGDGDDRERIYLKKIAAKQAAMQAALLAAETTASSTGAGNISAEVC